MEFETRRRPVPVINLSALIDVAFILVIFIVLAANFQRLKELTVELPDAEATAEVDPKALNITVPATGPLVVDGTPVELAGIKEVLAGHRGEFTSVLLMADQTASVQRAVRVLGDARAVGFESVGIATQGGGGN